MSDTPKSNCAKCSKSIAYVDKLSAKVCSSERCCGASFVSICSQMTTRKRSDRQALDRSLSRASLFDVIRNLTTSEQVLQLLQR